MDVTRRVLVAKSGGITEFMTELVEDLDNPTQGVSFPEHIFTANWQAGQLKCIKENLQVGIVIMVLDFGENFKTLFQDEIKSAHFAKAQITIHPIIVYYLDQVTRVLQSESLVMLSEDLQHDHHAVAAFTKEAITFLRITRGVEIKGIIEFTDGCTSQYKSASAFTDISFANQDFGVPMSRNFFGSEHGKGAPDGETGAIKSKIEMAILGGKAIIRNAKELFRYCKEELAIEKDSSSKMCCTFFLVNSINHERQRTMQAMTIKGTKKIHSLIST